MPKIVVRDGAQLSVDVAGSGPPLVLISGLGGTSRFWNPLRAAMSEPQRPSLTTISFDQRGIGGSERGCEPVTIHSLGCDTWDLIESLGIERPVLCGHSTGGAIAQAMAIMRPGSVAGVVLSGSWPGPDPFMTRMFGIRLEVLKALPARYGELGALLGSPPRWLRDNPEVAAQADGRTLKDAEVAVIHERIEALLAHDCRHRLASLQIPALVLGSEDDVIVPVYLQEELASLLKGAHLHLFDRGGHFFPVTRPVDTATVILDWIAELPAL